MKDERCPACGGRNAADTEFCVLCGTYLGWEDKRPTGPRMRGRGANPDTQLSVHLEQQEAVVVTPGAPPSPVTVHLTNLSTAVEAYRVAAVHAPPWLIVTPGQARLLPGTEARVQLTLAIDAKNRIPVRRFRLQVRVQGESSQALWREVGLDVVVGSVANPVQLRREPNQLRARDTAATVGSAQSTCAVVLDPPVTMQLDPMVVHAGRRTAQTHVILDNRRGTRPQRVHLAARAPEESLRFSFVPQNLEVPAGSYATARLSMQAARPGPGESSTRTVIVSAWDGQETTEAQCELVQDTAQRRPLLRSLMVIAGSLAMILGSMLTFLPWTIDPQRTGIQWNYVNLTRFFSLDTRSLDQTLGSLGLWGPVNTLVTVGAFTIFFGLLAGLGIFSKTGRLIRIAAVLEGVVLLLFAVLIVAGFLIVGRGFPGLGVGYAVVLGGCVLAFMGSKSPRR